MCPIKSVGRLLKILKIQIDDMNILKIYLILQKINLSSSEIYLAIKLYELTEKYPKLSLVYL